MDKKPTYQELEKRVQALEEHLSKLQEINSQLKKAEEDALIAAATKSEFLANMSHEIRTPMNGVIAAAELALGEEISATAERYINIIHSSGYSLLGIINDVLDYSKIEAGKLNLEIKTFKLDVLLKNITDLLIHKTSEKGTELLIDIAPEVPLLLVGDSLRIRQVIMNLVGNAVKFTKDGVISINVELKEYNKATGFIILEFIVKDTGIGIKAEQLEKLFKPFVQADSSTARKFGGTGLGLTISKQLIEMMNGEIWVESEYGHGTRFYFTLNIRYERRRETKNEILIPKDLIGLNVLVADDNLESQTILKRILDSFNFNTTLANTGLDALNLLKRDSKYDLLITDWMMPEMNGIELSQNVRQELKLNIPIIMLTAFGKTEEEKKAREYHVSAFLFKPINAVLLFDTIMEVIGKPDLKTKKFERRKPRVDYRDHFKGKRVLLVEDNQTNREIAVAILKNVEIFVEVSHNGKEACDMISNRPTQAFDAVLMDIQMPEMDGYEATQKIRQDPRFRSIPILAMTAHAMEGDKQKCLEAGMDGYISKPIEQSKLYEILAQHIKIKGDLSFVVKKEIQEQNEIIPSMELPIRLPGIDIKAAMDGLGVDSGTYRRIVNVFRRTNQDTYPKIKNRFNQKAWLELEQLAHSLKGSAANIGAMTLQEAAQRLEFACKNKAVQYEMLENVEIDLNQVLESIQRIDDTSKVEFLEDKAGSIDSKQLLPICEQLSVAIEKSDPEEIGQVLKQLRGQLENDVMAKLTTQLEDYDYDEALETLKRIIKDYGIQTKSS